MRQGYLQTIDSSMDTLTITVSRHSILQDLLHVFSDESIVERSINFRFEDEPAVDYDGVQEGSLL